MSHDKPAISRYLRPSRAKKTFVVVELIKHHLATWVRFYSFLFSFYWHTLSFQWTDSTSWLVFIFIIIILSLYFENRGNLKHDEFRIVWINLQWWQYLKSLIEGLVSWELFSKPLSLDAILFWRQRKASNSNRSSGESKGMS